MWQRNRDAFRRAWHLELGGIAVEPFVLLIGVGFGLGAYISNLGEGISYPHFLAPGVIAAYAMFHATFDATYGAYIRMETHHIYESILFTPLGPEDIVMGEVLWSATRALMSAIAVLFVAAVFGLVGSPWAILALPAAYLIGMTFAAIAMMMTATATTIGAMNNFLTLFILPMFWVSGVFFPLWTGCLMWCRTWHGCCRSRLPPLWCAGCSLGSLRRGCCCGWGSCWRSCWWGCGWRRARCGNG